MSSNKARHFVPPSYAIGSALELVLAGAVALLLAMIVLSPLVPQANAGAMKAAPNQVNLAQ